MSPQETKAEVIVNQQDMETLIRSDPMARLKVENIALLRTLAEKNDECTKLKKQRLVKTELGDMDQEVFDAICTQRDELVHEVECLKAAIKCNGKQIQEMGNKIGGRDQTIKGYKDEIAELHKQLEERDEWIVNGNKLEDEQDIKISGLEAFIKNAGLEMPEAVPVGSNGPDQ